VDGARDQFLARSGLSDDEHGCGAARRGERAIENWPHASGPADDVLEPVAARDEPVSVIDDVIDDVIDAVAPHGGFQDAIDFVAQPVEGERHGDEVFGAAAHGLGRMFDRGAGAHDEDGEIGASGLDRLQQVQRGGIGARFTEEQQTKSRTAIDGSKHRSRTIGARFRLVRCEEAAETVA